PLVAVLFALTRLLTRPFGGNPQSSALVTEDEIKSLVEAGQAQGVLQEREQQMITSIFAIAEKPVHEVMVPRTDIIAIDVETPAAEILKTITNIGHSRIPEYDVEQEMVLPVSETEALMDARVPFEDVRETFDLDLPPAEAAPDYDTLGGFVVAQLGRFPKSGEAVEAGGAKFVVESVEGRRIRRVRVIKKMPAAERV